MIGGGDDDDDDDDDDDALNVPGGVKPSVRVKQSL